MAPNSLELADFLVLTCEGTLSEPKCAALAQEIRDKMFSVKGGVALNLEKVVAVDLAFFRLVATFGKALRVEKKKFYAIGASRNVAREIRENGVDSLIELIEAGNAVGGARKRGPTLNVEFVNPFIEASQKTLKVQCGVEANAGKPFLKGTAELMEIDIAGVIGLVSSEFNGSIALCFPRATFLAVMGAMLGEKILEITDDLKDGVGELLNIIFGQSKVVLNQKGYQIEMAIPTIVSGDSLKLRHVATGPTLILPFASNAGGFYMEIGLSGS